MNGASTMTRNILNVIANANSDETSINFITNPPTISITAATATRVIYDSIPSITPEPGFISLDASINTPVNAITNTNNIPANIAMPAKSIHLANNPTTTNNKPIPITPRISSPIPSKFLSALSVLLDVSADPIAVAVELFASFILSKLFLNFSTSISISLSVLMFTNNCSILPPFDVSFANCSSDV